MVQETNKNIGTARQFKERLLKEVKVEKMIFFGSRVNGDYTPESDYDFIIVSEDFNGQPWYQRPRKLYLLWDYDAPVELLCYTPQEYENKKNSPTVVAGAEKTGITI